MEVVKAFLDVLKQPPLVVGIIGAFGLAFGLFVLLISDELAKRLHTDTWRNANGHWLLVAIAVSGALLTIAIALGIAQGRKGRMSQRRLRKMVSDVPFEERVVLAWCILRNRTTVIFEDGDGTASVLSHKGLLRRSREQDLRLLANRRHRFEVPPDVWAYMTENEDEVIGTWTPSELASRLAEIDSNQEPPSGRAGAIDPAMG